MSSFMMQLSGGREMVNEDKAEVILVYFVYFGYQINGYILLFKRTLLCVLCLCRNCLPQLLPPILLTYV
jgi:hypothetical protein